MLSTKVKASSITHLTDARYFAAWETEWLGFYLSPGEEFSVDARQVAALQEWVDGVKICGEFGLSEAEDILAAVELLQLNTVQLSMLCPLETLTALHGKAEIIQEIVLEAYTTAEEIEEMLQSRKDFVDYFLLNFAKGGIIAEDLQNGQPYSLDQLKQWCEQFPVLVDLQLDNQSPTTFAEQVPVKGFAVQGGEEEKTGYKSFEELDEFFEALEILV